MSDDGGFLIKFNGKNAFRCHAISFDHDEWKYIINEQETGSLPHGTKTITIEIEPGT